MKSDPETDEVEPGTISVRIYVGTKPTCPAGGTCIGQGWQKSYCGVFGGELLRAKTPDGKLRRHANGEHMFQKRPECLKKITPNSGPGDLVIARIYRGATPLLRKE